MHSIFSLTKLNLNEQKARTISLVLAYIFVNYNKFNAILGVWFAVASNVADACCNICALI